ncbi:phosphomethylpyrimidine kinase, putative [Plasmodium ovale wallikeri]|uniref:Phosphomethylpyrimidine kinase, putative n=1 Tax=Plasmodium ovale wallikeri TaxID=864142 RepID=A0A1A8YXK0_PLAOA|nr:phosphomethylpyrimidine kinase, putative [Plasmodium ovale wallikeri]SBT36577.1 phosphomethylpyrimidine kinase, putative [Plasmodium ovale wallikeri]
MEKVYNILSIAGSDSCGGAGMQADLKTAVSLGCHCCSVFVVLTAQNTREIKSIVEVDEKFIVEQLDSIFADITIDVVKLGVLYSKRVISLIHNYITDINTKREKKLVVVFDPVFVSSSGCLLVENVEYVKFALDLICPISTIITPNFYECKVILQVLNCDIDLASTSIIELCKLVTRKLNINACLFKSCNLGGHSQIDGNMYAVDHLCIRKNADQHGVKNVYPNGNGHEEFCRKEIANEEGAFLYDVYKLATERIAELDIHGTGCTLSTAIACFLSKKGDLLFSCIEAKKYIYNCIKYRYDLGSKSQGLNHMKASQLLPNCQDVEVVTVARDFL